MSTAIKWRNLTEEQKYARWSEHVEAVESFDWLRPLDYSAMDDLYTRIDVILVDGIIGHGTNDG